MRTSRWVIILWSALIVLLLLVELAEITHLFTLPIESAIGDPLGFVSALVFTTILALVGAIFIGVFVTTRLLRAEGFTPFEEEMLRMRAEIRDIKSAVDRLSPPPPPAAAHPADPSKEDRP
ncbi:MAG: hypothetical protein ACRECT_07785 [Thermoplasmata archaeon]